MNKDHYKKISFLATGTEIVNGEIYERNMHDFSLEISERGGIVFQHLACTDDKNEIVCALQYLLRHSDVVIITGGLGPTSDDLTRFALAEVLQEELVLKEVAWQHVQERLARLNLYPNLGQQQQAFFPQNCTLIPNDNGSAYGCYVEKKDKLIFMLPGPPRENKPLFTEVVLPKLAQEQCFTARKIYRWLTLGLAEGTIAPQIDAMAAKYSEVTTSYRWNYPYLEIKIICDGNPHINELLTEITTKLAPNQVSTNKQLAPELLQKKLSCCTKTMYVIDQVTEHQLALLASRFSTVIFVNNMAEISDANPLCLVIKATLGQGTVTGSITFSAQGLQGATIIYEHSVRVSYRPKDIAEFALAYGAWQLARFADL